MSRRYKVGTTSYIIPDDLIPNVEYLADRVDDIELLLFEVEQGRGNVPGPADLHRLADIAVRHDLGYTVHLPLDLELGAAGAAGRRSLRKAVSVVTRTLPLAPRAWVLHLEGGDVLQGETPYGAWRQRVIAALQLLCAEIPTPSRITVENLEGYPLDFLDPVLEAVPVGRCIDIGHLWVDGHDAVPYLERRVARTKVIHLHGIGTRDHQSLAHVDVARLRQVLAVLESVAYDGVLTLEVFNESDLRGSLAAIQEALGSRTGGVHVER